MITRRIDVFDPGLVSSEIRPGTVNNYSRDAEILRHDPHGQRAHTIARCTTASACAEGIAGCTRRE